MQSSARALASHRTPLPIAFRNLAWSGLCSTGADQLAVAAAPLSAVLLFAATPAEVGWLQTVQLLPFLLFAIPAGLFADRWSRRNLMLGAETLRFLGLTTVVVFAALGVLSLRSLALLGFVAALGTVSYFVVVPAMVPRVVPRSRLTEANRWLELARSVAYIGGPALAGVVIAGGGVLAAYALAAATALAGVALLSRLPREARPVHQPRRPLAELRQAAVFVVGHRLLRPIFITAVVFNGAWFVLQAIFVAYAVGHLGMKPASVGLTLALAGVGMVVGAVLAPTLGRRLAFGTIVVLGPLAGFVAAVLVLATSWLPTPGLAGVAFLLFGLGPILWTISTTTLRQVVTPDEMLGRVSALLVTATFGARPIGAAIGAALATLSGPTACLIAAACGFLVQLAVIWLSEVRSLRSLPDAG